MQMEVVKCEAAVAGRAVGPLVALDLVETILSATFSQEPRHLRRLGKVATAEAEKSLTLESKRRGSYVCNDS